MVNLLYAIHYFAALIQAQKTVSTFHRLLQFSEAFHLLPHTYAGVSERILPDGVFRNLTACEAPTWLQPFSFSKVQSEWNAQTHGLYPVHELFRCTFIFYHRSIVSLLFQHFHHPLQTQAFRTDAFCLHRFSHYQIHVPTS